MIIADRTDIHMTITCIMLKGKGIWRYISTVDVSTVLIGVHCHITIIHGTCMVPAHSWDTSQLAQLDRLAADCSRPLAFVSLHVVVGAKLPYIERVIQTGRSHFVDTLWNIMTSCRLFSTIKLTPGYLFSFEVDNSTCCKLWLINSIFINFFSNWKSVTFWLCK